MNMKKMVAEPGNFFYGLVYKGGVYKYYTFAK